MIFTIAKWVSWVCMFAIIVDLNRKVNRLSHTSLLVIFIVGWIGATAFGILIGRRKS